jgi:hypothetical protein
MGKEKEREPQFSDGVNLVSGSIEEGCFFFLRQGYFLSRF